MSVGSSISNPQRKDLEDMLLGVTTPLYVNDSDDINGSAFFYYESPEKNFGKTRKKYKDIWLITSKHVLIADNHNESLTKIKFHTRRIENEKVYWNNIIINASELDEIKNSSRQFNRHRNYQNYR